MLKNVLIFFYIITFCGCDIILPSDHENELAEIAADIFVTKCINCKSALLLRTESDFIADKFLKIVSTQFNDMALFTLKLDNYTTYQDGEPTGYFADLTIIFIDKDNYNNIEMIIFNIEILPFWYIRGKFLVVVAGADPDDEEWIQSAFQSFWERNVLRVLIVFWTNGPKIFAYNPYLENYGTDVTDRTDLAEIFRHKIKNMHGHPIRLYHLDYVFENRFIPKTINDKPDYAGMDGKFFGTIAHWLNASLDAHYISEDFPAYMINNADHDNTTITDATKLLSDMYDFDIMCNAGRTYGDNELDHVFLYDRNDMFVVLPRGQLIPRYLYIFLIVPVNVWCATFISLSIVSFIQIGVQKIKNKKIDYIISFINNYRLLLNESIPESNTSFLENYLMIIWIIFCIVFATLFQSALMTTLVHPQYYPDIDTLKDLYKTNIKVYAPHFSLLHLKRKLSNENKAFLHHLRLVPKNITVYGENTDWLDEYRKKYGVIASIEHVYYLKSKYRNVERPNYHIMKETVMPNAQAYNIRNERLFYEEILEAMGQIRQAGLYEHWQEFNYDLDYIDGKTFNITERKSEETDDGNISLTMEHLQVAFLWILFGNGVAFLVFIGELLFQCDNFTKKYLKWYSGHKRPKHPFLK